MTTTEEILAAVDAFLAAHRAWADNELAPSVPTEAYERAVFALTKSCSGDTPQRCRDVVTAVGRLTVEWNAYATGTKRQGRKMDQPQQSLWAAVENLANQRRGAEWKCPPLPEPVEHLLKQNVSISQIAMHMYAHKGKGPFLRENSSYDHNLVLQEAREPGSVCKEGWWEALHAEDIGVHVESLRHALPAAERFLTEEEASFTEDPATIEELLREGAFPAQIARVKHTTVDEVLRVARELDITPNEPDMQLRRETPPVASKEPEAFQPSEIPGPTQDVDDRIIELTLQGNGPSEVAKLLGVTVQKVSAVFREYRKRPDPVAVMAGGEQETIEHGEDD